MSRQAVDAEPLGRLDPDPAVADRLCAEIRALLVKFFEYRNHENPEDLAHETLIRGLERLGRGVDLKVPVRYFFFGVAKNVSFEQKRVRILEAIGDFDPAVSGAGFEGLSAEDLRVLYRQCLANLSSQEREDLAAYLDGEGGDSTLTPVARRTRIHRIRKKLWAMIRP